MQEYYDNLKALSPDRRMASAIKERAFRQKIGFQHGGQFIEGKFPQADPDVKRFFKNKGLNINKPISVFNISNEKKYLSSLRGRATSDPRVILITKTFNINYI